LKSYAETLNRVVKSIESHFEDTNLRTSLAKNNKIQGKV
jgi:hypothetical protein